MILPDNRELNSAVDIEKIMFWEAFVMGYVTPLRKRILVCWKTCDVIPDLAKYIHHYKWCITKYNN